MYQTEPFYPEIEMDTSLGRALNISRMNVLCFISEYIYQSIIFEDVYPELSERYNVLAMDEMTHYKALSELQYRLGVNPSVDLKLSIRPINIKEDVDSIAPRAAIRSLKCHIAAELSSADEYRKLAKKAQNDYVSHFLFGLADDEEEHARILTSLECSITTN